MGHTLLDVKVVDPMVVHTVGDEKVEDLEVVRRSPLEFLTF